MFARMRRTAGRPERVELCEAEGRVCTPASSARVRLERARTEAMYLAGFRR